MPRNFAGTYTLPAGNPVVAGTTIDASWANDTMSDLANEITNSLSRNGEGGMLAAFRVADGTVSAPGLAFTNETNSGIYRAGTGELWLAVGGVAVAQITANGLLIPSGKRIALPAPVNDTDAANKVYVDDLVEPVIGYADFYLGPKSSDPTLNNSGGALTAGTTYWSTTLSQMRVYNGTIWEPMPSTASLQGQTFSGTGAQTAFTLAAPTGNATNLEVFISGVRQVPTNDYTVSGTTLTFVAAPPSGTNNIYVRFAQLIALASADSSNVSFLPAGAGASSRTVQSKMRDVVSVKDFGAVGDGIADDAGAFGLANTAVSGGQVYVPPGTYRFNSSTSISAILVMAPGAVLKPNTSVKVDLSKAPIAGLHQIFDRSGGGAVQFIGGGIPEVYAEWWGARGGTGGRTDNNVPIQYALDAVQSVIYGDFTTPAPNNDNNGGVVVLGYATDYLMSGRIHLRNRARIRGQGRFSELKINNATWGADTELIYSVNGTSSQFWCRLEDLALNCNENTTITRVVYAPAWQESCGLRDVLIEKFRCHGVYIDNGYGGAVGATFKHIQFFPSSSISSARAAIYVDVPYSSGVFNLLLEEVSFAGWLSSGLPGVDLSGVFAKGRVRIQCRGVHVESFDYGVTLDTDASLYGLLGAGGNATVNSVVACNSTWTGEIDCPTINKGGSTYLVRSFAASPTGIYRDVEPIFKRVVYPHTPSEVVAYCRNTAAGGTLDSTAYGFSSITRTGAGQYTINFDATKFAPAGGGTAYRVKVEIGSTAGRTYYVAGQTATKIDLVFKDLANAVADCDLFDVFLYGRPGI